MKSVFFIDDDPHILKSMERIFRSYGNEFDFRTFQNPRDALALIEEEPPALCITDLYMPLMDGRDLIARIGNARPEVRCLLISGFEDKGDELNEKRLIKPIDWRVLLKEIREALGHEGEEPGDHDGTTP